MKEGIGVIATMAPQGSLFLRSFSTMEPNRRGKSNRASTVTDEGGGNGERDEQASCDEMQQTDDRLPEIQPEHFHHTVESVESVESDMMPFLVLDLDYFSLSLSLSLFSLFSLSSLSSLSSSFLT